MKTITKAAPEKTANFHADPRYNKAVPFWRDCSPVDRIRIRKGSGK